ncbi:VWA domain-containing protein [Haloferula sp. BvORR071]|uniref:VWA domain-containing protein n=1 Tax=Haloferula sp. BvORR071 TaxID=1396141 RepID=UPI0005560DF3|nr:VWA domain-containing protein [Haloferula sp. BvORR071]
MSFSQPGWLALLLLIPFFTVGAVLVARLRRKQWAAFAAPRLRTKLLRRGSPLPRWFAFALLMLATALLAFGLARPQTTKGTAAETTRGRNVLLALDLSRSMLVADLKPDRLTQAKTLCYELMEALPSDRIGLIGFAGEPYLFAPLTVDHAAVRETIEQLDIDYIPVGGSDLEGTLELAIKTLKATGQKENALILLTDGDETTGRMSRLAAEAKKAGVYIFAIAVGTEQGDYVPNKEYNDGKHRDRAGNLVKSSINTAALKKLAAETGGRFAVATSAASIPEMVKTAISDMEQFEIAGRDRVVPVEYYQWFLLPAILCLIASVIAGTRWRGLGPASAAGVAAVMLAFAPQPAHASSEGDALKAVKEGRHAEAEDLYDKLANEAENSDEAFRYRLAQGNAAYKQGETETARHAFSEALRSEDPKVRAAAHHGLGTILFDSGWKRLSNNAAYPNYKAPEEEKSTSRSTNPFRQIADALLGLMRKKDEAEKKDPMAKFDGMVRQALMDWLMEPIPDNGDTAGFGRFNNVLTDWMDAIKHFDSALHYDSSLEAARHNRALAVKHLKRLREILEEVQENAQQIQPAPGEGEGQGDQQPGEGGKGDQEGDGEGGQQKGKGKDQDGEGANGNKDQQGEGGDNPGDKKNGDGDKEKGGRKPRDGESPEDTARRILKENADFEKGALGPNRIEYRQPDKDW